jgi:hypothetical protein
VPAHLTTTYGLLKDGLKVLTLLVLNDHIVKHYATHHNVAHSLQLVKHVGIFLDFEVHLEDTKSALHIFTSC